MASFLQTPVEVDRIKKNFLEAGCTVEYDNRAGTIVVKQSGKICFRAIFNGVNWICTYTSSTSK